MSPNCQVADNALPPGAPQAGASAPSVAPPGPEHLVSNSWTMDRDTDVVFAVGHLHTGAINVIIEINGELKCVSEAIYGTVLDEPGNELGHLIGMTNCVGGATEKPVISVKKGDTFTVNGWYWVGPSDPRIVPVPAGPHLVVMSYMFVLLKDVNSKCEPALRQQCLPARAASVGNCFVCIGQHQSLLEKSDCSQADMADSVLPGELEQPSKQYSATLATLGFVGAVRSWHCLTTYILVYSMIPFLLLPSWPREPSGQHPSSLPTIL
jgi:hypothetical protein